MRTGCNLKSSTSTSFQLGTVDSWVLGISFLQVLACSNRRPYQGMPKLLNLLSRLRAVYQYYVLSPHTREGKNVNVFSYFSIFSPVSIN